jgi:hypothetical protein
VHAAHAPDVLRLQSEIAKLIGFVEHRRAEENRGRCPMVVVPIRRRLPRLAERGCVAALDHPLLAVADRRPNVVGGASGGVGHGAFTGPQNGCRSGHQMSIH